MPKELAGDDQSLHLAGALADGADLGVAVVLLGAVVLDEAVATVDLHAALAAEDRRFAGHELRFGGLERHFAGAVHLGGGGEGQRLGRGDARRHLGEREANRLEFGDRLSELLALLGVLERRLVGADRRAQAESRDRNAAAVEHRECLAKALARRAEEVGVRDEALFEHELRGVGGANARACSLSCRRGSPASPSRARTPRRFAPCALPDRRSPARPRSRLPCRGCRRPSSR